MPGTVLAVGAMWLLVAVGVTSVFAEWSDWPFRAAMIAVAAANVESTLITILLTEYRTDVATVLHAMRTERRSPS